MLKYLSLLCSWFFISSCTNTTTHNIVTITNMPDTEVLSGEELDIEGLGAPSRIYSLDTLLLLKDNGDPEFQMYVCGQNSNKVLNKFIRKGRGPRELLGVFYFAFSEDQTKIYVMDVVLNRICIAETRNLLGEEFPFYDVVKTDSLGLLLGCIDVCGDQIATIGRYDDARITLISTGEKSVTKKILYSPNVEEPALNCILSEAYEGVIKYNKYRNSCVIACRFADQIEIVDMQNDVPVFIKGPELFEPEYSVDNTGRNPRLAHASDERKGYVDLCTTDDKIYALYSGREFSDRMSSYGRSIRVFTWDGKCIANYDLNQDILAFTVTDDLIYAINSSSQIVKFPL